MKTDIAEENTHKESILEIINSLPIAEDFEVPNGFPIPINQSIIVKPVNREIKTVGGIILSKASSKKINSIGTIYAIGEEVNIPIRLGLEVDCEEFAMSPQSELNFKGDSYYVISQHTIRAICTPNSFKYPRHPNNDEKRRQDRIDEQATVSKTLQHKVDNLDEKAPR